MTRTLVATMASYHNFGSRKENLNQAFANQNNNPSRRRNA